MLNGNDLVIYTKEASYLVTLQGQLTEHNQLQLLKEALVRPNNVDLLDDRKAVNEINGLSVFDSFSDLEMVYYYIHYETNINPNKNKNENTKREYAKDLLQFLTYCTISIVNEGTETESVLKALGKRHIQAYQKWLTNGEFSIRKKGYSPSTVSKKTTVVKGFLQWLYVEDYLEFPLHAVFKKATVRQEEKPNRNLRYEEVRQLLDYYKDHEINHALLLILATTGARINEICQATWGDIYFEPTIKGGSYFLKVKAKGNKIRHVYLMHTVIESLLRMKKRRGLGEELMTNLDFPLFVTSRLKPYPVKYLSNYIIKIVKETNMGWIKRKEGNISPHWFRHYFVNHLHLDLKVDLTTVQKTVGHQSRSTTEGYVDKEIRKEQDAGLLLVEEMYR